MANKPISMSKVRQIIKLFSQGIGKKKVAQRLAVSKNTVKHYIDLFSRLQTTWEALSKLTDLELNQIFHPVEELPPPDRLQQLLDFFPDMEKRLRKRGMTLHTQFDVYSKLHPQGYKETQFYHHYNNWSRKLNPSMHIEHIVGDKTYVDYAGATWPYVDELTGEIKKAQVFVSILGWSQYVYVEALESQTVGEFIIGSENSFRYFNGVTLAIVPDNLKSAVFKACKYEPQLNENFRAFADHYGVAILPARARKPQDKAHVENMVKIVYQNIYIHLPEKELLTLKELNKAILISLEKLNSGLLTGRNYSRKDQMQLELPSLQPLPEKFYEMRTIKQVTVMKNGHVYLSEDQHYYSVPYELIGKKLKMQYSKSQVELYQNYELIASHKRLRSPHNYTTEPTHMPPQHRYVTEWSPAFFMEKAKAIDPVVEFYVSQVLGKKQHPEQSYKSCQGILSLAKRVGNARLIKACKRAHEIGYYNYKIIDDILKNNLDKYEEETPTTPMPSHENIRGGNYYQ
jgi:transposase